MKLEARLHTSDILADIDDTLFSVSNLSAKIAFDNLLPTCEIGEEIAESFLETGHFWPRFGNDEDRFRWAEIGRQRELTSCELSCECSSLPEQVDVPGLSQPYLLQEHELTDFRSGHLVLPKNDADAINYCAEFFGENASFEIGYGNVKPVSIQDLFEEEDLE